MRWAIRYWRSSITPASGWASISRSNSEVDASRPRTGLRAGAAGGRRRARIGRPASSPPASRLGELASLVNDGHVKLLRLKRASATGGRRRRDDLRALEPTRTLAGVAAGLQPVLLHVIADAALRADADDVGVALFFQRFQQIVDGAVGTPTARLGHREQRGP